MTKFAPIDHPYTIHIFTRRRNTPLSPGWRLLRRCYISQSVQRLSNSHLVGRLVSVSSINMGPSSPSESSRRGANFRFRPIVFTSNHWLSVSFGTYRIQNCFSTISAKILVNHYYFRDFWRILWCKSLWITHIFAMNSDVSVALIVPVMSAMPNHQL